VFKSLSMRYILAFILIFAVSFAALMYTMTSLVDNYSVSIKREAMENAANHAAYYVDLLTFYQGSGNLSETVSRNKPELQITLGGIVESIGDGTVLVIDKYSTILYADGDEADNVTVGSTLGAAAIREVSVGTPDQLMKLTYLGSAVNGKHTIYAVPLAYDGEFIGCVVIFSVREDWTALTSKMTQTMWISGFWILFTALIVVYFVTTGITSPIRRVGQAARTFAKGNFDTRLTVHGKDEVAELSIAFNQMAQSLETLEQTRNSFLADVAHDLRTPMTSISGFVDEILEGIIPPEKQNDYLQLVSTEIKRLSRMVNSLLEMSRITAGRRQFTMRPFNICEMARRILISFEQKIDDKKLDVEFNAPDDDLYAVADYDAIYQILFNLCDNAVKFSRECGNLKLTLEYVSRDKKIRVSVFNEGIGIPAADLPLVFDRFYKTDKSRGKDKTGVGLGLYISKTIIDAHGETISVESREGENCKFTFTLEPASAADIKRMQEAKTAK